MPNKNEEKLLDLNPTTPTTALPSSSRGSKRRRRRGQGSGRVLGPSWTDLEDAPTRTRGSGGRSPR